jgi:hypothetical protein
MRYVVRDHDGGYGVWDRYLTGWMLNSLGESTMSEYDAEMCAADYNAHPDIPLLS